MSLERHGRHIVEGAADAIRQFFHIETLILTVGTEIRPSQVVRNMGSMNQPWHCPHGRPTMRHLTDVVGMGWNRDGPGTDGRRVVDFDSLS